ncbi:MAG: hypothetical protein RLZZ400_526, partial [Actinomycetota bacterium]
LLFLDKQRNAASSSLYKRVHGDDRDNDSKVEDEALDK